MQTRTSSLHALCSILQIRKSNPSSHIREQRMGPSVLCKGVRAFMYEDKVKLCDSTLRSVGAAATHEHQSLKQKSGRWVHYCLFPLEKAKPQSGNTQDRLVWQPNLLRLKVALNCLWKSKQLLVFICSLPDNLGLLLQDPLLSLSFYWVHCLLHWPVSTPHSGLLLFI